MSSKFQIQYNTIYTKTTQLRSRIEAELSDMENTYRQVEHELHDVDGETNAYFMETMERNQIKAKTTAEILHKLLTFIELSSRQVEYNELVLKGMYSMGNASTSTATSTEASTRVDAGTTTSTETTSPPSQEGGAQNA